MKATEIDDIFNSIQKKRSSESKNNSHQDKLVNETSSKDLKSKKQPHHHPYVVSSLAKVRHGKDHQHPSQKSLKKVAGSSQKQQQQRNQVAEKEDEEDGFADSRGILKSRKTEEGYKIYSLEELNIGNGGDTPDCPFDCQCCY